jgi:hypothetical protein
MIIVFFVPGMFGSTIEALIRSFTSEFAEKSVAMDITKDGSMHTFRKQLHPFKRDDVLSMLQFPVDICTPIYPMEDAKLNELAAGLLICDDDKLIVIHANSSSDAELNMLFQYHKIATGVLNKSEGIFCGDNGHSIVNWNSNYTSWQEMKAWELREWLSIFYPQWILEWVNSKDVKFNCNPFLVSSIDILTNLESTFLKISEYLGLTIINKKELTHFCNKWTKAQQYIVDEYRLIDLIVSSIFNNEDYNWPALNIIAESIIQKRLRDAGYELKCYNLNTFPTNSKTLANLLEKV